MRLILDCDSLARKSWKQHLYNVFFLIFLISGISLGLTFILVLIQSTTFKANPELFFGIFGITGWLIVMGIMEIKESLKSDYDRQIKESLQNCGCVCLCPKCNGVLNHISNCSTELSGIIRYACPCGNESSWDFDLAPVPICIEESAEPLFKKD